MSAGNPHLSEWKAHQHGRIPAQWLASPEVRGLNHAARSCLTALVTLLRYQNGVREGWQSYNRIGALAGTSRRQAMRSVGELVQAGVLLKRHRFREFGDMGANLYRLVSPPSLRSREEQEVLKLLEQEWTAPLNLPARVQLRVEKPASTIPDSAAKTLCSAFHQAVRGDIARHYCPPAHELAFAEKLLEHGQVQAWEICAYAIRQFKGWVPGTLFSVRRYVQEALASLPPDQQEWQELSARALMEVAEKQAQVIRELEAEADTRRAEEARQAQQASQAAQEALAAIPGLIGRLADLQHQLDQLPEVVTTREGKPRPIIQIAAERGQRASWRIELVTIRSQLERIQNSPELAHEIAAFEDRIERLAGSVSR